MIVQQCNSPNKYDSVSDQASLSGNHSEKINSGHEETHLFFIFYIERPIFKVSFFDRFRTLNFQPVVVASIIKNRQIAINIYLVC